MIADFPILMNSKNHFNCFTFNDKDPSVICAILRIFLAAEFATSKADKVPWLIEDKLNKRRKVFEFDCHLQQMLLYIKNIGNYYAHCIECGNKSLYKTELKTDDGYYLHFNHSFNYEAKYNKKYIELNEDTDNPKFAASQAAEITDDKNVIVIPSRNIGSHVLNEVELSKELNHLRQVFLNNKNVNPTNILDEIKNFSITPKGLY